MVSWRELLVVGIALFLAVTAVVAVRDLTPGVLGVYVLGTVGGYGVALVGMLLVVKRTAF